MINRKSRFVIALPNLLPIWFFNFIFIPHKEGRKGNSKDNRRTSAVLPRPKPADNKVTAHRGGSLEKSCPDNSIESLNYAVDLECFASECDFYLTNDDKFMDAQTDKEYKINGLHLREATCKEIKSAGLLKNGEYIPTSEDYLDRMLQAGTIDLWLNVKSIITLPTEEADELSSRCAEKVSEIIRGKKANNFVEFIVAKKNILKRTLVAANESWPCGLMKTKLFIILLLITVQFSMVYGQSTKKLHTVKVNSLKELQDYFSYKPDADILISGHRGGMMTGYPENSIEACEKTLTMIPSFFEIDPRLTKDSVMVLMHDADIKRTTNGSGAVSDYTFEELRQFNLKDRKGNITPYKIPTILEMFEWGKDKTVFNLDNKDNGSHTWDFYIKQLKKGGEWYPYMNIILSVRSLEEAMYYWERGVNDRMFCVEISSTEHFDAYDRSPIPWNQLMAYIRLTVDPEQEELYQKLHEKGVSIMTSIHPTADRVSSLKDRRAAYLRELMAMPDIIETDYPSEFTDIPRSREELHHLREKAQKRIGK